MENRAFCPVCGADTDRVSAARAARIIDRSPQRVRQLLDTGRFPNAFKTPVSGSWQIPMADIEAYLAAREDS